jgi:hypothetical protein
MLLYYVTSKIYYKLPDITADHAEFFVGILSTMLQVKVWSLHLPWDSPQSFL